jgi:DNA processing protein
VLAGGIDNVYPPEHAALQRAIGEKGCLVSENPPGFAPRAQDFPRRNRIISGIALGVLIVEAARRSGTLITARTAAEQGREVFAVPGHPLDPRAEGTNRLLKSGATMVTEPEDILDALAPMLREPADRGAAGAAEEALPEPIAGREPKAAPQIESADRERLLAALGPAPIDIDELARATGLTIRAIQIALIELALAGRIERHGHQLVSLNHVGDVIELVGARGNRLVGGRVAGMPLDVRLPPPSHTPPVPHDKSPNRLERKKPS